MIRESLEVGPLCCNCHVLIDPSAREAVVIDPGEEPGRILERVGDAKVVAILHTHGHFDHVTGTRKLREETGAPIMIHADDRALYEGLREQYAFFGIPADAVEEPLPVDAFLEEGQEIAFGRERLRVIHTPGHTPGSCCFHREGELYAGDTLFRRGIGRTDFPGGSFEQEAASIRDRLYALDPGTVVHPGHGPDTRIGEEQASNPFVPGE